MIKVANIISYGERGLRSCEKKWSISDIECLSLLTGIREYHVYLAAAPFVLYTDHISLKYLQSVKLSAHNRSARWVLTLQPYKLTTEHVEGKKLTAADGLSRHPYDEPGDLTGDEELQEDSFVAQMEPDIFDSMTDNGLRIKQPHTQWQFLSINAKDEDASDTQNQPRDRNLPNGTQDLTTQPSETIDLWSVQDKDIRLLQHQSKDLQPILSWLEDGILPATDKEAR